MLVPLTPYLRRSRRRNSSAFPMLRSLATSSRALVGRIPPPTTNASTSRLTANVVTDLTTGTSSS
jgi:hypothetical protein